MTVAAFKNTFQVNEDTPWPCPSCHNHVLRATTESLVVGETADSRAARRHEDWEPEWITERFAATLKCAKCGEIVASAGRVVMERDWDEEDGEVWGPAYAPDFLFPAPPIFVPPPGTPEAIKQELQTAFQLYWPDSSACANRIRRIVERVLDDQDIRRFMVTKKGKRVRLDLHKRIQDLPSKYDKVREHLLALKWLGNAGSHIETDVQRDGALDGFRILRFVLTKLYDGEEKEVSKLSKGINKRKGKGK